MDELSKPKREGITFFYAAALQMSVTLSSIILIIFDVSLEFFVVENTILSVIHVFIILVTNKTAVGDENIAPTP